MKKGRERMKNRILSSCSRLHRRRGCYGSEWRLREELRRLPDCEIARRRGLLAERLRTSLASPEVFLAWQSLKSWREFARIHPDLASRLELDEADLDCLDEEAERRLRRAHG